MARLRDDYEQFAQRGAVVLAVGPNTEAAFQQYWHNENLPFVGIPDPEHRVLKLYGQEVKLFKLGRLPAQMLIDQIGKVRFVHYGHSMADIPPNEEIIELIKTLPATG